MRSISVSIPSKWKRSISLYMLEELKPKHPLIQSFSSLSLFFFFFFFFLNFFIYIYLFSRWKENNYLESTDAAPEVPHLHPTRLPARRTVSRFFFFFFFLGFAPMRLDSCRIGFDSRRIGLIRPKSGHIGHIGTYRPAADTADTAETGRKRPKSALSMAGKSETCILLSFFVNQGLVCVLKIYFNSKNI